MPVQVTNEALDGRFVVGCWLPCRLRVRACLALAGIIVPAEDYLEVHRIGRIGLRLSAGQVLDVGCGYLELLRNLAGCAGIAGVYEDLCLVIVLAFGRPGGCLAVCESERV